MSYLGAQIHRVHIVAISMVEMMMKGTTEHRHLKQHLFICLFSRYSLSELLSYAERWVWLSVYLTGLLNPKAIDFPSELRRFKNRCLRICTWICLQSGQLKRLYRNGDTWPWVTQHTWSVIISYSWPSLALINHECLLTIDHHWPAWWWFYLLIGHCYTNTFLQLQTNLIVNYYFASLTIIISQSSFTVFGLIDHHRLSSTIIYQSSFDQSWLNQSKFNQSLSNYNHQPELTTLKWSIINQSLTIHSLPVGSDAFLGTSHTMAPGGDVRCHRPGEPRGFHAPGFNCVYVYNY